MTWCNVFSTGAGPVAITSLAVNSIDDIFFVGTYYGTLNFGGDYLPSASTNSLFVASFGSRGYHRWSTGYNCITDIDWFFYFQPQVVATNDSVVVSTGFHGNVTVGTPFISQGYNDGLLFSLQFPMPSPTVSPSQYPTKSPSMKPSTTATPSSTPSTKPDESSEIPPETIAAASGAAGGTLCLFLIVIAGICWIRRRKKRDDSDTDSEDDVALESQNMSTQLENDKTD